MRYDSQAILGVTWSPIKMNHDIIVYFKNAYFRRNGRRKFGLPVRISFCHKLSANLSKQVGIFPDRNELSDVRFPTRNQRFGVIQCRVTADKFHGQLILASLFKGEFSVLRQYQKGGSNPINAEQGLFWTNNIFSCLAHSE